MGKGLAREALLLKHLDAVSKWAKARVEIDPPSLPLFPIQGWVTRSLVLAALTPLELGKLTVCQACSGPTRNTNPFPQPSWGGGRASGKESFHELWRAGQVHQRQPGGGKQSGKRICKDEGDGAGRQTDGQTSRQTNIRKILRFLCIIHALYLHPEG